VFLIDGLEIFGLTFLEVEEKALKVTERTRQSLNMSYSQFTHFKWSIYYNQRHATNLTTILFGKELKIDVIHASNRVLRTSLIDARW